MKRITATVSLKLPPVRNPFVALAIKRKAGPHRKSEKTMRQDEKGKLSRALNSAGQSIGLLTRESSVRFRQCLPFKMPTQTSLTPTR